MAQFAKTTKNEEAKNPHYHIVYLNETSSQGICSSAENHVHQVVYQPSEVNNTNPQAATASGGWFLYPAEDGHIHDIAPYEIVIKQEKEDETTTASEILQLYKEWKSVEYESIKDAREAEDFYSGKQWTDEEMATLQTLNRAHLTINLIAKHMDELSGFQREQRTDFKCLPFEDGDQRVADLCNVLLKYITERCGYPREESKVFDDTIITGRGNFNVYVSFDNDIQGDIVVEHYPWDDVIYGPHNKEDLGDCEGLIKEKMFSIAKVKQLWEDKAEDLSKSFDKYFEQVDRTVTEEPSGEDPYLWGKEIQIGTTSVPLVDIARKEIRVIECWRKVYKKVPLIVSNVDDFVYNAAGWARSDVNAIKTLVSPEGEKLFTVIERPDTRIRITRAACGVILSDENPADVPVNDFYMVPTYAKKRGDRFWGKVKLGIDPQKEINKRHSQAVDIGNKMCAYGWFYDESTFKDDNEKTAFKKLSSSPGWTFELQDVNRQPAKVEGVKFPGEIVQLLQLGNEQLSELLNVIAEPAGANTSGAMLLQLQKSKLRGNEYVFDNFSFAKQKLGKLLLSLVQRYYSPERVWRIVNSQNSKTPVTLDGQDFSQFTQEEITGMLENTDLAKYDIVVSEATYSPTLKLGVHLLLSDLASKGYQIPPEILIETIDMPDAMRQKIMNAMAQQQQQAASTQEQTKQMEENKTLIKSGIIPPSVKQRLQQEAQQQGQQPAQQNFQSDSGASPIENPQAGM
jgi:hypothetical protein